MSWIYAAATFAAGALSEHEKRKGRYGIADERNRAARESLLTAKFNISQNKIESRQTQYQVLDTGGNLAKDIALAGLEAEGSAEVAAGTSGALVESGSPRAVLASIVNEAIDAQTNVIVDTRNRIRAIARDTENKNTSIWRNAKLNEKQQKRIAKQEKKSADREYLAGMIKTGVETYGAAKSGKTSPDSKKTVDTKTASPSIDANDAQKIHGAPTSAITAKNITKKKRSMDSYRWRRSAPTKSSSTWDNLVHQMQTRQLDFSEKGFKDMWDFAEGSSFWNFIRGRGRSGKAHPGRMKGASR